MAWILYDYCLRGVGKKEIVRRRNRLGRKTPAQLRAERYGKKFCTSHRIHQETIDAQVLEYAELLRGCWKTEQSELRRLYKLWSLRQPMIEARIAELREEIRQDEEDIDELLILKIQRGK